MMTKKDKKQQELKELILKVVKDQEYVRNSFIAGTGVGKSKIIMDLLAPLKEILQYKKILILVDNTRLRDHNWKEDFEKWGYIDIYNNEVETNTYQTAYKWTKSLDGYFVIADEFDFAVTTEYSKFFINYKDIDILAMSGYITDNKRKFLVDNLPIIFEYTQEQAQADGILNKTKVVFVKYDLSRAKAIEVSYAKDTKKFKTSENSSYDYWDKQLGINIGKENSAQSEAGFTGDWGKYKKYKRLREISASKRAEILYNAQSSIDLSKHIITKILEHKKSNKIVVFTIRTSIADQISPYSYHNKNSDEVNNQRYADFNSGVIRELSLVDKINRGVNIVGLNYILFAHFNGSDTKLRQRLGRSLRLNPEDVSTLYVLLPYFMRKTKVKGYIQAPTAAIKWAENMFKGWDLSTSIVKDLRTVKSDI